jgi:hypothetical protein
MMDQVWTKIADILTMISQNSSPAMAGKVLSLLIIITMIGFFWKAHSDPNSKIDFSDLFIDQSGKIGGSQMRLNLAFGVSTWVIVFYTLNGTLSEWLFTAYLAAFVYDRVASRKLGGPTPAVVIKTATVPTETDSEQK